MDKGSNRIVLYGLMRMRYRKHRGGGCSNIEKKEQQQQQINRGQQVTDNVPEKAEEKAITLEQSTDTKSKCPFKFTLNEDGSINYPSGNKKVDLKKAFGTDEDELVSTILCLGAMAMPLDEKALKLNVMGQAIAEYEPKNATEARLIAQAHALYTQGMNQLDKAGNQEYLSQQDHFMKNATKMLRLHNETVLTLNKLRKGGEQKVIVQHVNVNEGGQAALMTGSFQAGGGEKEKSED